MTSEAPRGVRARLAAIAAGCAVVALLSGCGAPAALAPAPQIPAPSAPDLTGPDVDAWLDGLVPAALERSDIAGATVAVVRDGQVLTTRGYGWADTGADGDAPRRVDPDDTLFRVGSISKVFVATAVLQQVEQGRIDLDADVQRYLDFPLPRRYDGPVTMRHLLTHTAGFEERIRNLIFLGESTVDLRDTVAVDPPEQVFEPGTVPSYSNYGYAVAGYIVERTSGMPFADYVERNVLDRAGMASSSFAQPLPPDLAARLSRGYPTASSPAGPFETVGPAPAGALSASTTDMARFMLAQLGEAGPGQPLLRPETLAMMRQPALDAASLGTLADGPRMALGLFDESRGGNRIVGHGGDTDFFHSHMQLYPDARTGIFISLNSSGRGATDTLELRESLLHGFTDRYFPPRDATPPPATTITTATETTTATTSHAALAEGTYESARLPFSTFLTTMTLFGQTKVTARQDGTVLIEPGPLSLHPAVYREIRPWVWQEVGGQRIVTMRVADDQVQAIGFESAFTLLRTPPTRDAAIVLPVLAASVAVLLLGLLAWPVGAMIRRHHRLPAPGRPGRVARVLTRVAAAVALLALAGWTAVVVTISGLQEVPEPLLRALQGAQWVALLGVLPAAARLVASVRYREGVLGVLGSVCLLLALAGTAWFAEAFGLLSPDLSY
jgi:CubicO group peptidase (beta-lactamase class C family)